MEELFKSLSESVSEECYGEIMSIVEQIISEFDTLDKASHIKRVYGEPEYKKDNTGKEVRDKNGFRIPANKAAELYQIANPLDGTKLHGDGYLGQGSGAGFTKRDKNIENIKDITKSVDKSIARHKKGN